MGRSSTEKAQHAERMRTWYKSPRNREQAKFSAWRYDLKKKYGMVPEEFDAMLLRQGGLCAICKCLLQGKHKPHVDHCHTTGVNRGLLCTGCNTALHKMERDIQWGEAAKAYLEHFKLATKES